MPILSAQRLSVARGERVLLKDFSLTLEPGALVHLRGANGAGKTSLLETLAGLRRPAAGEVARPDALHWIGHRNALNLALSPLENLRWWCAINALDRSAVQPALEQLGVGSLRHRACRTLSAGQKRRSALARLVASKRPLWLLDEPLDGLDADGLALIAQLLSAHLSGGGAAMVTSHQPLPAQLPRREVTL
ncbi:MAG TPA: heme ABC exporter ATP-binding protein CcmA [Nevskiaceae bacterium]|nr:heme ABC exporter ATP-binding protein CcmA [Nevskiaceae bacterium]